MLKTSSHVCSFYRLLAISMLWEMAHMLSFFTDVGFVSLVDAWANKRLEKSSGGGGLFGTK
jgi:hypothetical protein